MATSAADDPMAAVMAAAQAAGSQPNTAPAPDADPMASIMAAAQSASAPNVANAPVPASDQGGGRGGQGRGAPSAAAQPTLPANLNLEQTLQGAGQNFLPSLGRNVGSMVNAVTHPMQTLGAVGQLGMGAMSQAADVAGIHQDPGTRSRSQALLKSLEGVYGQRYGSVQGFAHAVASDPVSVLMDASTFLDGAGAAADAAKLGTVADALHMASPLGMAGKGVGLVSKAVTAPASGVLRGAQAMWSGAPYAALRTAAIAGAEGNPALQGAFLNAMKGNVDTSDLLTRMQGVVGKMSADRSASYLADKGDIAQTPVGYAKTYAALDDADQQIGQGSNILAKNSGALDALKMARASVDEMANDPAKQFVGNADALKRQLYGLASSTSDTGAANLIKGPIYNAVKNDIADVAPGYNDIMENYQSASKDITDMQKSMIGAGNNPAATTALRKGLRALRTPEGNTLLDEMGAHDPTIPYTLAGAALSPWWRGGQTSVLEWLAAGGAYTAFHNPALAGALAVGQSPRIAGMINYNLGQLGGAAGTIGKIGTPTAEAAYVGAQASPNSMQPANTASAPANSNLANAPYPQKVLNAEGPTGGFMPGTWLQEVRRYRPDLAGVPDSQVLAMRNNKQMVAEMIGHLGDEHAATLQQAGIPVNDSNKWGMHWLGPGGYPAFYNALKTNPDTPMSDLAPALFPRLSPQQIARSMHDNTFDGKLNTVGKVAQRIQDRMGSPLTAATGGRITAATGGKIEEGKSVEELLAKLMARSEQVKRYNKKATEPLLKVPDNAIAAALKTVRQSI